MAGVYLDSCILIYLVEGPEALHRRVVARLLPVGGQPPNVVVSDLTRLECRVGPLKRGDRAVLAEFDQFFARSGCTLVPLTAAVMDRATELRARHGLRVPDALHLAAALVSGCDQFWTNDQRLKRVPVPIKIEVLA